MLHLGKPRLMISLAIESFQTLHRLPVYSPLISFMSHTQSSFPGIILKPNLLLSFFASIIHHSPSLLSLSLSPSPSLHSLSLLNVGHLEVVWNNMKKGHTPNLIFVKGPSYFVQLRSITRSLSIKTFFKILPFGKEKLVVFSNLMSQIPGLFLFPYIVSCDSWVLFLCHTLLNKGSQ